MSNRERTAEDVIKDNYYAENGVRTGSGYNEFVVTDRELRQTRDNQLQQSLNRKPKKSATSSFSIPYSDEILNLVVFGPGCKILEPILEPIKKYSDKHLTQSSKSLKLVALTFSLVGVVLSFLIIDNQAISSLSNATELPFILFRVIVSAIFGLFFYGLGMSVPAIIYTIVEWLYIALGASISFLIYIFLIYGGYYIYLNLFNGSEISILTSFTEWVNKVVNILLSVIA